MFNIVTKYTKILNFVRLYGADQPWLWSAYWSLEMNATGLNSRTIELLSGCHVKNGEKVKAGEWEKRNASKLFNLYPA